MNFLQSKQLDDAADKIFAIADQYERNCGIELFRKLAATDYNDDICMASEHHEIFEHGMKIMQNAAGKMQGIYRYRRKNSKLTYYFAVDSIEKLLKAFEKILEESKEFEAEQLYPDMTNEQKVINGAVKLLKDLEWIHREKTTTGDFMELCHYCHAIKGSIVSTKKFIEGNRGHYDNCPMAEFLKENVPSPDDEIATSLRKDINILLSKAIDHTTSGGEKMLWDPKDSSRKCRACNGSGLE